MILATDHPAARVDQPDLLRLRELIDLSILA